jgi:hypothetical protein
MKPRLIMSLLSVACSGQPLENPSPNDQPSVPTLQKKQAKRRVVNHVVPPVSAAVPVVIVRSIAEDGDDLAEELLQFLHEFPRFVYLAGISTVIVLPIIAIGCVLGSTRTGL